MGGVTVRLVGSVGVVRSGSRQEVTIGSRKARRLPAPAQPHAAIGRAAAMLAELL